MKILKEETLAKETLPISFLTDMISKGWEEVGYLKEAAAAIGAEYTNTEKIEQLMQDLMDAYLVFIGQIELHMHEQDYIEEPKVEQPKPATQEPADEPVEEPIEEPAVEADVETEVEEPASEALPEAEIEADTFEIGAQETTSRGTIPTEGDFADFFVDFDEPDMSEPRLTDDDLYGHEDSEFEQNKLKSQLRS